MDHPSNDYILNIEELLLNLALGKTAKGKAPYGCGKESESDRVISKYWDGKVGKVNCLMCK